MILPFLSRAISGRVELIHDVRWRVSAAVYTCTPFFPIHTPFHPSSNLKGFQYSASGAPTSLAYAFHREMKRRGEVSSARVADDQPYFCSRRGTISVRFIRSGAPSYACGRRRPPRARSRTTVLATPRGWGRLPPWAARPRRGSSPREGRGDTS